MRNSFTQNASLNSLLSGLRNVPAQRLGQPRHRKTTDFLGKTG
jgi:hypothetical protein